uniref:Uncharacterized protein n=1 Tax=Daphnia galeata TaxID=27404 RepID=A0A8J2WED6_9CRUS|nr:unnamed protein product [Daphnia galeata]
MNPNKRISRRSGRVSEVPKLPAYIGAAYSRSSTIMEIPSPPVSWTNRRQIEDDEVETLDDDNREMGSEN